MFGVLSRIECGQPTHSKGIKQDPEKSDVGGAICGQQKIA